ncbi:MAG TPA: DUF3024 domain-containing protein [Mycobacterium sp.]|nr:DUF3024 domain-containing protein [Mycobacterium sp.]
MPLPDEDVALVRGFVETLNARMPPHVAGRMRYEAQIYRNAITLVEIAPLDFEDPSSPENTVPVARLRFTRSRGWELYWSDRNSEFHVYDLVAPTQDVRVLLAEIDRDPTCIFFG